MRTLPTELRSAQNYGDMLAYNFCMVDKTIHKEPDCLGASNSVDILCCDLFCTN